MAAVVRSKVNNYFNYFIQSEFSDLDKSLSDYKIVQQQLETLNKATNSDETTGGRSAKWPASQPGVQWHPGLTSNL